jgi:hypothetical protein
LLVALEKADVPLSDDFGSSLLGLLNLEVFTGTHCKEDCKGCKLACCPFEFRAVVLVNFGDD